MAGIDYLNETTFHGIILLYVQYISHKYFLQVFLIDKNHTSDTMVIDAMGSAQ